MADEYKEKLEYGNQQFSRKNPNKIKNPNDSDYFSVGGRDSKKTE
jgi:hypothetical protein